MRAEIIYFGGVVREQLRVQGLDVTPENERKAREEIRQKHGMAAVAKLAAEPLQSALSSGKSVVIDGLYSLAELDLLRQKLHCPLILIALHSSRKLRYERLRNRPKRPFLPEEVDRRDEHEIRSLDKGGPIALADYHVVNDGDLEQFTKTLEHIAEMLQETLRLD